jgi:hypothetical protein
MVKRETPELHAILPQLGDDERRVLAHIAERLLMGQRQYGELDLKSDKRDWKREREQEVEDLLMYFAFESLKRSTKT